MSKRPSLGKGLDGLGLSELLGDLNTTQAVPVHVPEAVAAPEAVAVVEAPAEVTVAEPEVKSEVVAPIVTVSAPKSQEPAVQASAPAITDVNTDGPENASLKALPVDVLKPGRYQPRRVFAEDALQSLADSIKSQGIIQPIVVRRMNDGYEIIAGERRWRAAQRAGLHQVPVVVKDLTDEAALAMSLIENIQRRDLNVIEEAIALERLANEFQLTHQEVATAVGKSRTSVTNLLRLLKLNNDVRLLVENGDIEMGHARALLSLEGVEQSKAAQTIVARELSVRQAEIFIRRMQEVKSVEAGEKETIDPDVLRLQTELAEKLGAGVQIQHTAKGKGRLVVQYHSLDELQGILEHIQ